MPIVTVCPTQVAHLQAVAVAEIDSRQMLALGVDLEHGEIGVAVGEQHFRLELAAVGERHHDVLSVFDDMIVGEDDAVGAHDDARAQRLLHALAEFRRRTEEALEKGIGEERVHRRLDDGARIDVHDSRRHALDDRREGQLHLRRRLRHLGCRRGGCRRRQRQRGDEEGGKDVSHGSIPNMQKGGTTAALCNARF
jgi:hypothetical protein